jgi:phosphonate transport system substrate-binding protein
MAEVTVTAGVNVPSAKMAAPPIKAGQINHFEFFLTNAYKAKIPPSRLLSACIAMTTYFNQAERFGVKEPNDQATKGLVNYYRSQILVRKDSGIKSIKDLKGKKIAVQDTTSTAGWIFPAVELLEHGINVNKDGIKTVQVKGHDQGVLSVYNKNTDAAFVFQGARNLVKKDVPNIMSQVVPIYTTGKIPNDTITVRGDMTAKWQKKIAEAFKAIAKTKQGHAIISSVYSHEGYADSKDSNFDIIRDYDKKAEALNK